MRVSLVAAIILSALILGAPAYAQGFGAAGGRAVINGQPLAPAVQMRFRIPAGRYWYDRKSGLWGVEGGPARGLLRAGLPYGGRLAPNASRGRAPVWINGRRLTFSEVAYLKGITGRVPPGRYWLDGFGNVGRVGGPAITNLRRLVAHRGGRGRGDGYFRHYNSSTGTNIISGPGITGITTRVGGKTVSWIR